MPTILVAPGTDVISTKSSLGSGQWGFAVANVVGSVLVGLAAVRLGILAAEF